MGRRSRTRERILVAVAAVVAMAVVLVAPVQVRDGALVAGEACAEATTASSMIAIGMVVDFGVLKDPADPASLVVTCVPVAVRTNGLDMLAAAGHNFRLGSSGLVCAIDGLPEGNDCGERTPSGYRYWAYFQGNGSAWAHSGIGPSYFQGTRDATQGWHFVEGAGNPTDPPPRRAPTNICPVTPPPTDPPAPAPAPTVASAAPTTAPVGPPAVGAPPSGAAGGPASSPGPSGATPTTTSAGSGAGPEAGAGTPAADGTPEADPDASTPPGTDADAPGSSPATSSDPSGASTDVTMLASAQVTAPSAGGGAPLATIIAVAIVAAVGGAAAWRFRTRSDGTG